MWIGIVDIETTDFLERGGHIVDLGIAGLNTDTGEIKTLFNSVCREHGMTASERNAWIFSHSDLTIEDVRNAPLLDDLKDEIQRVLLSTAGNTAYNKRFDFSFLVSRGFDIGYELPCPMLMSTPIVKATPIRYGSYKWPSVEESWRHYFPNEPYCEAHRGLDDAKHEARIVYELFKLGHYNVALASTTGGAR